MLMPAPPPPETQVDGRTGGLSGCRASNGKLCVFPFRFAGTEHSACTVDQDDKEKPWCSTK